MTPTAKGARTLEEAAKDIGCSLDVRSGCVPWTKDIEAMRNWPVIEPPGEGSSFIVPRETWEAFEDAIGEELGQVVDLPQTALTEIATKLAAALLGRVERAAFIGELDFCRDGSVELVHEDGHVTLRPGIVVAVLEPKEAK